MATTSRFGLHYQALTDAPDGAALGGLLAEDVDDWLCRAYPVADAASRAALSGLGTGFVVLQQDDNTAWVWSGSAWAELTGSTGSGGGGGGGVGFVDGQWRASANQSLTNSNDTVLGFGVTETSSTVVTRATSGVGHKFTLGATGIYSVSATVRFASGAAGPRFIELRNSAQNARYASHGVYNGGTAACTLNLAVTRQFTTGQELVLIATQTSGGLLTTDYQGTSITDGFVRLNIALLG